MVPLADMGNHKHDNQTYWEYLNGGKGFVIRAERDIKKDEEITLKYGYDIASYNWFTQYGFVCYPNNRDQVIMQIAINEGAPGHTWKKDELLHKNLWTSSFRVECDL